MDLTALLLSRIQFGSTIAFHIIFPSFSIGLAAWLTVLEALHLWTGRPTYRLIFEFWLKIFGIAFGLGVVSGIVMSSQFGTNWSVLARMSGPIQGPLLSYETFTAFTLEAAFFGVLDHGQQHLDAGAGRLCGRTRRLRAHRLDENRPQFGRMGSIPAHAAG